MDKDLNTVEEIEFDPRIFETKKALEALETEFKASFDLEFGAIRND